MNTVWKTRVLCYAVILTNKDDYESICIDLQLNTFMCMLTYGSKYSLYDLLLSQKCNIYFCNYLLNANLA